MKIRVKSFASFRAILPRDVVVELPPGSTVTALLDALVQLHPPIRDLLFSTPPDIRESVMILKNGRNIAFTGGTGTSLDEGDLIAIFPPLGGG